METKLTALQTTLLERIITNEFYEQGFESVLWQDVLMDSTGWEPQKFAGVLVSLRNKHIITTNDNMVALTLTGKVYVCEHYEVDINGRLINGLVRMEGK